jgi:hypothetical protein
VGNEENEVMTVGEVARLFKVPVSWAYERCNKPTCTSPSGTGDQLPQLDSEPLARAYVFVISKTDGPVIDALHKLITALSSQETGSRMPSPQIAESWLEHAAAAEYLGAARSTLYRYSERHEIELENSAADSNTACRVSINSKLAAFTGHLK